MRALHHACRFGQFFATALVLLAGQWPAITAEAVVSPHEPSATTRELQDRAQAGDASAQTRLGDVYAAGDGVDADQTEAAGWYTRAAEQGYHEAQVKLAGMYRNGTGVQTDHVTAFRWLTIASVLVPREQAAAVRADREALARELARDEVTRAEAQAREWLERFERERPPAHESAPPKPLSAGRFAGVVLPRVIREVRPNYTEDALRRKIRGTVWLEAVVLADGTVGEVHVVRSLDRKYGLDKEAIEAARQWRFHPGTKDGVPVPVLVTIELTFQPDRR